MKTPFGSSVAAIKLAMMVEQDPKSRRFVSSTLSEFNHILCKVVQIKDVKTTRNIYLFIRDGFMKRVEQAQVPPLVKSYLKNVLSYRFRMHRDCMEFCYDAVNRYKKEKPSGV